MEEWIYHLYIPKMTRLYQFKNTHKIDISHLWSKVCCTFVQCMYIVDLVELKASAFLLN